MMKNPKIEWGGYFRHWCIYYHCMYKLLSLKNFNFTHAQRRLDESIIPNPNTHKKLYNVKVPGIWWKSNVEKQTFLINHSRPKPNNHTNFHSKRKSRIQGIVLRVQSEYRTKFHKNQTSRTRNKEISNPPISNTNWIQIYQNRDIWYSVPKNSQTHRSTDYVKVVQNDLKHFEIFYRKVLFTFDRLGSSEYRYIKFYEFLK